MTEYSAAPPDYCTLRIPDPEEVRHFFICIKVTGGYWDGATYEFEFNIPEAYPHEPPIVACKTMVYNYY